MIGVAAVGAGAAAYSANQSNKARKQGISAMQNMPKAPDYGDEFTKGFLEQYKVTPWLAQQEMELRQKYAPQQAKLAASLYEQYLPQYAQTNMRTLKKIDPESIKGRKQLFGNVTDDLASGYKLRPELLNEIANDVRAAQTARGNYRGNAPISEEAMVTAKAREGMYQQRLANMMNFLRGPTPQDHFSKLAGAGAAPLTGSTMGAVSPGYEYVEPARGWAQAFAANSAQQFSHNQGRESNIAQATAVPYQSPWGAAMMSALGSGTSVITGLAGMGGGSVAGAPSGGAVPGYSYNPKTGYSPV